MLRKFFTNKKGQGLVEYGLIIAGVALISAAAVSVFGHKTSDLISAVATVIPGAHLDDNGPIVSGSLIETTSDDTTGAISLDVVGIEAASGSARFANNVLGAEPGGEGEDGFGGLILEAGGDDGQ